MVYTWIVVFQIGFNIHFLRLLVFIRFNNHWLTLRDQNWVSIGHLLLHWNCLSRVRLLHWNWLSWLLHKVGLSYHILLIFGLDLDNFSSRIVMLLGLICRQILKLSLSAILTTCDASSYYNKDRNQ